jgi:hypothetical protein
VRWAAIEAIQHQLDTTKIALDRNRVEARRGRNIAKVAAARKLFTLVYYGLRDQRRATEGNDRQLRSDARCSATTWTWLR